MAPKKTRSQRASKKARTQPPTDIIVKVGTGDKMQEFECHSLLLRLASEYFNAMLTSPMKEATTRTISFPDKDPEEWKEVYKFMDPRSSRNANLTVENVNTLLPWFHMFQMTDRLNECDEVLRSIVPDIDVFSTHDLTTNEDDIKQAKSKIFSLLETGKMYGLQQLVDVCSVEIEHLLQETPGLVEMGDINWIISHLMAVENVEDDSFAFLVFEWLYDFLLYGVDIPRTNRMELLRNPLLPHLVNSKCNNYRTKAFVDNLCSDDAPQHSFLKKTVWKERRLIEDSVEIPKSWRNESSTVDLSDDANVYRGARAFQRCSTKPQLYDIDSD